MHLVSRSNSRVNDIMGRIVDHDNFALEVIYVMFAYWISSNDEILHVFNDGIYLRHKFHFTTSELHLRTTEGFEKKQDRKKWFVWKTHSLHRTPFLSLWKGTPIVPSCLYEWQKHTLQWQVSIPSCAANRNTNSDRFVDGCRDDAIVSFYPTASHAYSSALLYARHQTLVSGDRSNLHGTKNWSPRASVLEKKSRIGTWLYSHWSTHKLGTCLESRTCNSTHWYGKSICWVEFYLTFIVVNSIKQPPGTVVSATWFSSQINTFRRVIVRFLEGTDYILVR